MSSGKHRPTTTANTMDKFNEVKQNNLENVKKIVENYSSSSSEEDDEEFDEVAILKSVYQHYQQPGSNASAVKPTQFLENALQSGAAACLICIGRIRRTEAIWSCKHCYCCFHLQCIRRWASDSMAQQKKKLQGQQQQGNGDAARQGGHYNHLGEYVPPPKPRPLLWCCPQCRAEFKPDDRPNDYYCFCGKEQNPQWQAWLVPHSCGEICGKQLQPDCGHKCMLLCHPGPCPPCAQYARVSCLCGQSPIQWVRCVEKQWQCEKKCQRLLLCGEHECEQLCHRSGECPPCGNTKMQACVCGQETTMRSCADLEWHCKKVCGQKYACGRHNCRKVCHAPGACGECPLGLPRSCPCGKTKKVGPCSEIIDTCGDTCHKVLACGMHTCTQRCHRGACNLCLIIVKKKCRCGMHEKELPCSKEFTCDTKCKNMRDCGKHSCNKKCCNGIECPPCDKVCGKPLSCQKHKCQSVCHQGPCYPCQKETRVNCSCGKTTRMVRCGQERSLRIMCQQPCRIPSKCHHATKHRCHKGECPPCQQQCGLPNDTTGCAHLCKARCHAAVKTRLATSNNPWGDHKRFEYKALPHPKCEEKVQVNCIGGHELAEWPCWNSRPSSCGRKCQRLLNCGNHKCDLICHSVPNIHDMKEQLGCQKCERGCDIPRDPGCIHRCTRPCHLPPCAPCQVHLRSPCHCGLTQVLYKCSNFYDASGTEFDIAMRQEKLKCCGNRCLKNFPCGHRCISQCHSGPCPSPELCRKRVRIFCQCKRLKQEVTCDKHREGLQSLDCNEQCQQMLRQMEQQRQQQEAAKRLEEEAKNRLEVEMYEKKFQKRKPKERKARDVEEAQERPPWHTYARYASAAFACIVIAVVCAWYMENSTK